MLVYGSWMLEVRTSAIGVKCALLPIVLSHEV